MFTISKNPTKQVHFYAKVFEGAVSEPFYAVSRNHSPQAGHAKITRKQAVAAFGESRVAEAYRNARTAVYHQGEVPQDWNREKVYELCYHGDKSQHFTVSDSSTLAHWIREAAKLAAKQGQKFLWLHRQRTYGQPGEEIKSFPIVADTAQLVAEITDAVKLTDRNPYHFSAASA